MTTTVKNNYLIIVTLIIFVIPRAMAVRPFITDDSPLIGYKRMEINTWGWNDKDVRQLWHLVHIGLHDRLELTIAGVWGMDKSGDPMRFSYTVPLFQVCFAIRDYEPNKFPGVTVGIGSDMPYGKGAFVPGGYGAFGFLTISQCFGEDENVFIHTCIGGNYLRENKENLAGINWGIGTQIKVYKGFHGVGEIISGDPFVYGAGIGYQVGLRQFINDHMQVDFAFGNGIGKGDNRKNSWISCGIRYVLSFNKSDNFARGGRKVL